MYPYLYLSIWSFVHRATIWRWLFWDSWRIPNRKFSYGWHDFSNKVLKLCLEIVLDSFSNLTCDLKSKIEYLTFAYNSIQRFSWVSSARSYLINIVERVDHISLIPEIELRLLYFFYVLNWIKLLIDFLILIEDPSENTIRVI